VISGFGLEIDENCGLLCRYAVSSGNLLRAFRDNLSVPPSKENLWRWDREVVQKHR